MKHWTRVFVLVLLSACGGGPGTSDGGDTSVTPQDAMREEVLQQDSTPTPDEHIDEGTDARSNDIVELDVVSEASVDAPSLDVLDASSDTAIAPDTSLDAVMEDSGACPMGQLRCTVAGVERCIDGNSDRTNCGTCGMTCGEGLACERGRCTCPAGQMRCGDQCVDTQTSGSNCGACGTTCGAGQRCVMGRCACEGTTTMCGGQCVDTQSSEMHCGACGMACPAGQSCSNGRCACPSGQLLCGGVCVDPQSSTAHCGACGTACPSGQLCNGGTCSLTCTNGRMRCGSGTSMTCVDVQSDASNCGACGNACPAGSICRAGVCGCDNTPSGGSIPRNELCGMGASAMCRDLNTDRNNCGACGNVCGTGLECRMGRCECTGGLLTCGTGSSLRCLDGSSDENNCGACGNRCTLAPFSQLSFCAVSQCQIVCQPGRGNCDGNLANGCETNVNTNENCGVCGRQCNITGQSCQSGTCACPAGQSVCGMGTGAICRDLQNDRNNCGMCGNACPSAQTCQMGSCRCPIAGQILCNGVCVDPQTDNAHCNGCNMACTGGMAPDTRSCRGGMCLCPAGQTWCAASNRCVNTQTDALNCNGCGNICPGQPGGTPAPGGTQTCVSGACSLVCAMGRTRCGTGAGQYCADTATDVNNCNGCGNVCTGGKICGGAMGCVCPAGQTDCGGTCRNLNTDPLRCGSCTNICPGQPGGPPSPGGAQLCSGGMCGLTCAAPLSTCGTGAGMYCANLQTDSNNCRTCGTVCTGGKICGGAAGCVCPTGQTDCGGTCRNLTNDNLNCNGCGNICPGQPGGVPAPGGTQTCVSSACTLSCGSGLTRCGTGAGQYCADTATDNNNCRTCGTVCTGGKICGGAAGCVCPTGQTDCGGTCRTLTNDRNNCGLCGNACPGGAGVSCSSSQCVCTGAGQTLCPACPAMTSCDSSAMCRTLATDNANCGGCGIACTGTGRSCSGGNCVCTNASETYCMAAGGCVNLQTNTMFCGSCTRACSTGQSCVGGNCIDPYPVRVSVSSAGVQGNGQSPNLSDRFSDFAVSSDGRYVAFTSYASNLVTGDTNNTGDVFVRDTVMNTTTRVSVDSAGNQGNIESFSGVSISADGRYVAFTSSASNLVTGDTNNNWDVFVRDTVMNTTTRVSVDSAGNQGNSSSNYGVSISADGRYVAFASYASNLVTGDTNNVYDVFVRDTAMNTTRRVSVDSAGNQGNIDSVYGVSISADGRYVAFTSFASNLVTGDTNNNWDVFVRDTVMNTTTRVSVDSAGNQGNLGSAYGVSISADGRYLAFGSAASNLVPNDTNGQWDLFFTRAHP